MKKTLFQALFYFLFEFFLLFLLFLTGCQIDWLAEALILL